jgi:hypothetical protein
MLHVVMNKQTEECEISASHGGKYEDDSLLGYSDCGVGVDRHFRGVYCLRHQADVADSTCL